MNDGITARQQIVEKIKASATILVTVGKDPSVDELSAALGLTALLNNLGKHATAVVSGQIPPAIDFLEPGKTFENTVDSLRDFIIALDKEKADHLRYKVDGDVVKIFITPYRTTISEADLDFSQGDYNVELVLALGVDNESHLDAALESHGRILHDAVVATISNTSSSTLGSIDWYDQKSSSLSEMLVALSEALKGDKPVLDEQVSTAFLTGIVAATDRFSNEKTSSKVMTMAAQLMAAGANQQLIAARLEDAHAISESPSEQTDDNDDGTTSLSEGESTKLDKSAKASKTEPKKAKDDGSLSISHEPIGTLDEVAKEVHKEQTDQAADKAEDALAAQLKSVAPAAVSSVPSVDDLQSDIAAASADVVAAAEAPAVENSSALDSTDEPSLGGTLNATTEEAAESNRLTEEDDRNKTILSHSQSTLPSDNAPVFASTPFNGASVDNDEAPLSSATNPVNTPQSLPPLPSLPSAEPAVSPLPTLADIDQANRAPQDDALAAVHAAYDDAPTASSSESQPVPAGLPPLPDFSTLPPLPNSTTGPFAPPPIVENSIAPEQLGQILDNGSTPPAPSSPSDPGQFKIPGQS